jgi:hypothetical protein
MTSIGVPTEAGPLGVPRILLNEDVATAARPPLVPAPDVGWSLIGTVGLVFLVVAGTDLTLLWYPAQLGAPQWEFGVISRTYDGLPLLTMGLVLSLGGAVATGRRWLIVTLAAMLLLLAVALLGALFIYATDVPIALNAVREARPRSGLKRAIAKSVVQGILYPAAFIWLGVRALRWARRGK